MCSFKSNHTHKTSLMLLNLECCHPRKLAGQAKTEMKPNEHHAMALIMELREHKNKCSMLPLR